MSIIEIIKGSSLFYDLYDEEIDSIINKSTVLSLEKGDFIVRDGDEGDEIFILLTGKALVQKDGSTLVELKKGDLFGELVLLNENIRTADVVADTFSDVLVLKYQDIFSIFRTNPKVFSLLILNLSRLLTMRLKNATLDIKNLNKTISEMQQQITSKTEVVADVAEKKAS